MTREIKFRAWDKRKNRWIEPDYTFWVLGNGSFWRSTKHDGDELLNKRTNEDDRAVLMQYTGLKDKNGKEIYEGDVVTVDDGGEYFTYEGHPDYPEKYPIEWNEDGACFSLAGKEDLEVSPFYGYATLEVIGNIYENPNLLDV